ncbi:hypothetical protein DFH07DRAFT_1065673 [Mycena maculata]|uniref:Uncharacterized protein n=1 Tax=Mycena maculata TaxID=230809 RepID=A0AAD7HZR5_9AGAR|nr:hypothetical protein DFH07DRAFT_1065673 [Mycena maculata]
MYWEPGSNLNLRPMKVTHMTVLLCLVLTPLIFAVATSNRPAAEQDGFSPLPKKETNADRFRRGLSPLPPTRRDRNKLTPRASAVPCIPPPSDKGTLQLHRVSNGNKIGYVGMDFNEDNAYSVHRGRGQALIVIIPPAPFGVPINLVAENGPDPGHPYLGAVENGQGDLGVGEAAFAYLSGTSGVSGNILPSFSAGTSLTLDHGGIESQIWTMNCQTRQITAQWTNPDGQLAATIFYDPDADFLGLTGDLQAVSESAFEVTMTFIPG